MSTRCQVRVQDKTSAFTLYHHWDGYPTNMLGLIDEAWRSFSAKEEYSYIDYYLTRAPKVASLLCAIDPGGFEPEMSNDLHGDIEWYYVLNVTSQDGDPKWHVNIYTVNRFSLNLIGSYTTPSDMNLYEKLETKGSIGDCSLQILGYRHEAHEDGAVRSVHFNEAEIFSVYKVDAHGLVVWLADCTTLDTALRTVAELAELIERGETDDL